jgi:hypothetical protein
MYGKKIKVKGKNPLMNKMSGGPRGRSVSKTADSMRQLSLGAGQIRGGGGGRK